MHYLFKNNKFKVWKSRPLFLLFVIVLSDIIDTVFANALCFHVLT